MVESSRYCQTLSDATSDSPTVPTGVQQFRQSDSNAMRTVDAGPHTIHTTQIREPHGAPPSARGRLDQASIYRCAYATCPVFQVRERRGAGGRAGTLGRTAGRSRATRRGVRAPHPQRGPSPLAAPPRSPSLAERLAPLAHRPSPGIAPRSLRARAATSISALGWNGRSP